MSKVENIIYKFINKWIKSVDLFNLSLILLMVMFGVLFVTTASPNVAKIKGLSDFYFIKKHYFFVFISIFSILSFSILSISGIIKISYIGALLSFLLIFILLYLNLENNGSVRWLKLGGFSFQPSEFLKPFIIIIFSFLLTYPKRFKIFNHLIEGKFIAFLLLFLVSLLLISQPNFSMFVIVFLVFSTQYFLVGINFKWAFIMLISIIIFTCSAYYGINHVKYRIDSFFNPKKIHYQVEKSLEAYQSGGILGKGPGAGTVKKNIPDSHTDFIFPVIAEEYGAIVCIAIILTIFTIFFRGLYQISKSNSSFKVCSCTGLLALFLFQALINIAVSMKLIPTTGVTLPFISYGGSSLISMGIVMGMMLALTRKEFGKKGLIYDY